MPADITSRDDLYDDVADFARTANPLTAAAIQKRTGIGYQRARRLLEQIQADFGITNREPDRGFYDNLIDEKYLLNAMLFGRTQFAATGTANGPIRIADAALVAIEQIKTTPLFDADAINSALIFIFTEAATSAATCGTLISLINRAFNRCENIFFNTVVQPRHTGYAVVTIVLS
jgi:hypothetical protein